MTTIIQAFMDATLAVGYLLAGLLTGALSGELLRRAAARRRLR